jgi:hypothetical protein
MMRYKEEFVGTTRLRQQKGSQHVAVKFREGPYAGRVVLVIGILSADRARAIVIEAGRVAEAEDRRDSTLAEVNAGRGE